MPGEIVIAAQILAGSGTVGWLADKLLGPSVDALGERLRVFASERLTKISQRTEELAGDKPVGSLLPGFAYIAIQKASFSEDDDEITSMWAHLILDAACDYRSKHALYVDILAQMGSNEARELARFMAPIFTSDDAPTFGSNVKSSIRNQVDECVSSGNLATMDLGTANIQFDRLLALDFAIPAYIVTASLPYRGADKSVLCWLNKGDGCLVEHDVLIRQQLLEKFDFDTRQSLPAANIEMLLATPLGLDFFATCTKLSK